MDSVLGGCQFRRRESIWREKGMNELSFQISHLKVIYERTKIDQRECKTHLGKQLLFETQRLGRLQLQK